jgi:hypothetical protein
MGEKLTGIAALGAVLAFVVFAFKVPPRQGPPNDFAGRRLRGRD